MDKIEELNELAMTGLSSRPEAPRPELEPAYDEAIISMTSMCKAHEYFRRTGASEGTLKIMTEFIRAWREITTLAIIESSEET